MRIILAFVIAILFSENIAAQTDTTYNIPGNHTFTIPAGVTSITIQAWGGGASGGAKNDDARSGGGGGGYVTNTYSSITAGQAITITIGSGGIITDPQSKSGVDGTSSSYNYNSTGEIIAGGGLIKDPDRGGQGGAITGNFDSGTAGGNGADRIDRHLEGGGGGGSGASATNANGQTGGNPNGGNGGNINQSGGNGIIPGGGGGGKGDGVNTNYQSGNGANGQVIVSWIESCTTPPIAICKNIVVELDVYGEANITGSDVDNGSTSECGLQSLSATPNNFTCNEVGDNSVNLTIVDNNNASSTCEAIVTIEDNIISGAPQQIDSIYNTPGNHTFTIPIGVTSITLEAWGGGGSAGNKNNNDDARGGGGGGGYVTNTYSVTGGQTISIVVGAGGVIPNYTIDGGDNGDNSSYNYENNGNVIAGGGLCSTNSTKAEDNGGPGGTISGNYDTGKIGGNGADRIKKDLQGGGGGGSGLTSTDASGQTGGTPNGGIGGNIDQSGGHGIIPGGGGGGKGDGDETVFHSGNGANGQVIVSWEGSSSGAVCQDIAVQLDTSGEVSITAGQIDNGSSDACGIASLVLDKTLFTCDDIGTNTVTLTATDNNENIATCSATVTVEAGESIDIEVVDLGNSCQSGETGSTTTITWDINLLQGSNAWTYDYTINDGSGNVVSEINESASGDIQISYITANETAANKTYTITLTNVIDECGVAEINTENNSDTVTLFGVPATSDIKSN